MGKLEIARSGQFAEAAARVVLGVLLVLGGPLLAGCSEDTTSKGGDGDGDSESGGGGTFVPSGGGGTTSTGTGGTGGDGDNTSGDGDNTSGDGDNTSGDGDATAGDGDGDGDTAGDGDGDGDAAGDGDGDGDAAGDGDGDGDAGGPVRDGTQDSYCEDTAECNGDLECNAVSRTCTATCTESADCASLGSDYACGSQGICRVDCENASCPDGQTCLQLAGGAYQRCGYPEEPPPVASPADATFNDCADASDCTGLAVCSAGSCTIDCTEDADCDGVESGGGTAECSTSRSTCTIDCMSDGTACPGDAVCTNVFGDFWRCRPAG